MHSRRQILKGLGAAAGAAMLSRTARADLTAGSEPTKILQIFLHRAPAHSQTLWVPNEPPPGHAHISARIPTAVGAHPLNLFTENERPGLDHDVNIGAGFHPLLALGGASRTHLVAMKGEFSAHLLAASYALSGINIGNPAALSLGARVQNAWGTGGFPKAWVLDPQGSASLTRLATATGSLPPQARPFVLPVGRPFVSRLQRGGRDHTDGLLALYREQYGQRLEHGTGRVRAPAFDTYDDAMSRMASWEQTYDVLAAGPDVQTFSPTSYTDNGITRSVQMAVHLLHHGARCVTVIGGQNAAPDFDTHDFDDFDSEFMMGTHNVDHSAHHNAVFWGICEALRTAPNLDLDNTMVVFHSEFGRFIDDDDGSEHWNDAYAAMLFGGPVVQAGLTGRLSYAPDGNNLMRSKAPTDPAYAPLSPAVFLDGLAQLAGAPDPLGETLGAPTSEPIFQLGFGQ